MKSQAILLGSFFLASCANLDTTTVMEEEINRTNSIKPPIADVRPQILSTHGEQRIDNYYWLRDDERKDPQILAYLEAENAYTEAKLAHTRELQDKLYAELKARLKEDDASVPVKRGDYYYYRRYEPGQENPVYARRAITDGAAEQVLLDGNQLGAAHDFYRIGSYQISPNQRLMAWSEDIVSRNQFRIQIKNLSTGQVYPERIEGASTSLAWAADNQTLFYIKRHPETLIPYQVWRHKLGTKVSDDVLVYQEEDEQYTMFLYGSRDQRYIVIGLDSTLQTEYRVLRSDTPEAEFSVLLPREAGHIYYPEVLGDQVFLLSNRQATNFRMLQVPLAQVADKSAWRELIPHRDEVLLDNFTLLNEHLVVEETQRGIKQLRIVPLNGGDAYLLDSDEPAYMTSIDANPEADSSYLRYGYSSLTTPYSVIDLDLQSGKKTLRKRDFAGPDFDAESYQTRRIYATARDGVALPITLLHKKGVKADGQAPLFLLGYGAYGSWYEPAFRRSALSLVDRGFVFAIAHIRGGQEMGRQWYENGKLLKKKNTFTDFIDIAESLVDSGWAHPDKVVGYGRSAGGLLIGAVANMAPQRFKALLTAVPFVDVMTTMLDESIPLTTFEYDEWGNPNQREYFDYMMSYSPYDQVTRQAYPHLFVSSGLWDSQVQYWEPAKWVAKLRRHKTDNNHLLLYTDMKAGHGGGSGRYARLRDTAREYAFILDVLGMPLN